MSTETAAVAALITDWIADGPSAPGADTPRRRFIAYQKAAHRMAPLQRLVLRLVGAFVLAGRTVPDLTRCTTVFAASAAGWQLRGQVMFTVVAQLQARGVSLVGDDEADLRFDLDETDEESDEAAIENDSDEQHGL